ncbi:MAG: Mu-like prophage major head subunit gpT family protein [Alphaproteobacteria bacterium]|nr:Mu-like prophage major head subunit gpT family protein [Alphaproteobacteria bacterium]
MSGYGLSSRAIIGEFYETLERVQNAGWLDMVSMYFNSDQESETYKWLGQSPGMREWIGGRQAKGFRENGITIANKKYESTLEVSVDELRRDKTGQIMLRVQEQADRAADHWFDLLTTLIVNGESGICYDGQYFFDTDHSEGDSGTQDNDLTYNVGTTTAPTAAEMEAAILNAMQALLGFKDDQGKPMNANAKEFLVMVPAPFFAASAAATKNPVIVDGSASRTNLITNLNGFQVRLEVNPRLTWTTKFAVFTNYGRTRAFIRQEEEPITMAAIAEGSELEFTDDKHLYGIKSLRNVGYGMWQKGCLTTLT